MANYDVLGNVVVVKFDKNMLVASKKKWALAFLKEHKNVTTVLEKVAGFSRRLRTQKTRFVAGEKTKEAIYRENGCIFRFNSDNCYFSPRLSAERLELAGLTKKGEEILVMFGGVAPFAVVIAKHGGAKKVVSVELGRECNKYAKENVSRNKLEKRVDIVQGDVRRVLGTPKGLGKFDRIVMARPNLKDSFLDVGFRAIRKNGMIHYYGFYLESGIDEMLEMIKTEAKKARRQIRILKVKKAGNIGIEKFRWRVDLKVI